MARPATLKPARARASWVALAAIALGVLLAHLGALHWLEVQWRQPSVLRPLAAPMLTRQIRQQAPVAVAVAPRPAAPARPTSRAPRVADAAPREATSTLAVPDAAATPPQDTAPPTLATAAASDSALGPDGAEAAASTASATRPAGATEGLTVTAAASGTSTATTATGAPSYLDAWPTDTRLTYALTGNFRGPLHGDARVQWLRPGERYEVRIDIAIGVLASVVMTSQGRVTPQGLRPELYEEQRGNRRSLTLGDTDILLSGGKTVARPPGVQDTASQFVELTQQFAGGRAALETGGTVSFWMARPGAVDFWTYDITEKVTLQTPGLGPVEAFHLKPRPLAAPRGNITAEMWFAPTLQYLPVRIRINMGDDVYVDLLVEKIEQR